MTAGMRPSLSPAPPAAAHATPPAGPIARRIALLAAGLVALASCDPADAGKPPEQVQGASQLEPATVRAGIARREPWARTLQVTGNLAVDERSTLGAKVAGRLAELRADTGSIVSAGDVLARMDDVDFRLRVQQSEAQVAQVRALLGLSPGGDSDDVDPEGTAQVRLARAVLEEATARRHRVGALREQAIFTEAEYDEAEAAARVAQERVQSALQEVANLRALLSQRRAELALARQMLSDAEIRAPYDGIVLARRAGRGDYLASGAAIVEFVRADPLRLRAEVPEREAPRVRVGQTVRFRIDGDPGVYEGVVRRVPPELDLGSRSLAVEIEVPNRGDDGGYRLRGNAFARVTIVTDPGELALAVPASAVRSFAGVDRVLVIENGAVRETLVRIGRQEDDRVEILDGLNGGESIVLDPGNLTNGRAVRVTE